MLNGYKQGRFRTCPYIGKIVGNAPCGVPVHAFASNHVAGVAEGTIKLGLGVPLGHCIPCRLT